MDWLIYLFIPFLYLQSLIRIVDFFLNAHVYKSIIYVP